MKGFLVLLVLAAAGLAGVLYWRRSLQELRAPVVAAASASAKEGRDRRKRKRRGARRLARNDVFVAAAPPGEGPPGEAPSPSDESRGPPRAPAEERAPLAPGGSATTEAAPSEVFGALAPSPAAGGKRQPVNDEPEPVKLSAADLRIGAQGEDLSRPEVVHLDMSDDGHELSQDEIDTRFHAKEDAVLACIARARPDEYTWVPGQVTVKFRILRAGAVKGVRVEAPAILLKGGLYGCVKGIVGGMKFPAGTMNQIVTYPFSLT